MQTAFDDLTAYALFHFESEEAIWNKALASDDWEAEHQQSHQKFVTEVLRIKALESTQPLRLVQETLLSFLMHWLCSTFWSQTNCWPGSLLPCKTASRCRPPRKKLEPK